MGAFLLGGEHSYSKQHTIHTHTHKNILEKKTFEEGVEERERANHVDTEGQHFRK